jgi:hypothetical protein
VLGLRNNCSFILPLVYALMKGRMLVIHASPANESQVRMLVTVLKLFVPGHSTREQVIPWRQTTPLVLADIARIKLIGLSKKISHGIPKVVLNSASVRPATPHRPVHAMWANFSVAGWLRGWWLAAWWLSGCVAVGWLRGGRLVAWPLAGCVVVVVAWLDEWLLGWMNGCLAGCIVAWLDKWLNAGLLT